jgi:hypothetical protein
MQQGDGSNAARRLVMQQGDCGNAARRKGGQRSRSKTKDIRTKGTKEDKV